MITLHSQNNTAVIINSVALALTNDFIAREELDCFAVFSYAIIDPEAQVNLRINAAPTTSTTAVPTTTTEPQIFENPNDQRTEDYISGRIG